MLPYKTEGTLPTLLRKGKTMLTSSLITLSPLLLVLILLIFCKISADIAGFWGLIVTVALAVFYFDTSFSIIPSVLLAGSLGSLPVGLVIAASILQVTIMAESGALGRIIALIKTLTPHHQAVQVLLINVGIGILLTGLGAASVAIFPPLLMGLGYSISASILLPAIGYVALCMYALLGIPAVIMAHFAGASLHDAGLVLASFMPTISVAVAFACLHIVGGFSLMFRGFWPALITGLSSGFIAIGLAKIGLVTVTAIFAGLAIVLALLLYVKVTGGVIQDRSLLTEKDLATEQKFSLVRAASPWLVLLVFSLLMNTPALPFFNLIFNEWSMPLEIIPGNPEKLRLLWQAYTWVLISTFVCLPFLKIPRGQTFTIVSKGVQRAWRPLLATMVYFCIAYVMNHSGKNADWVLNESKNMILILAHSGAGLFASFYPAATPFLGLLAGFIGGSASSSVAMFTKLHLAAGASLGVSTLTLATANGIGGGLASAISPSKLFGAAASIDKPEALSSVMGYAFVLTFVITSICAVLTQWVFI